MYETAFAPKHQTGLYSAITTPAIAGPSTLDKLTWVEFRTIAVPIGLGATIDGTMD